MASTADEYFAGVTGWQADVAAALRGQVMATGAVTETLRWGHPVYEAHGPVALIKVYSGHVTLGLWRGTEMMDADGRLEPGGAATMASLKIHETDVVEAATVQKMIVKGASLNEAFGDPLKLKRA